VAVSRILLLGGAGFVGSRIAIACVRAGHSVQVVDGLLQNTSGRHENLAAVATAVDFVAARVEEVADLEQRIAASDVVIDSMGWTLHRAALADPLYDLELNLASHVHWLGRLPEGARAKVIYLGSRAQYGDLPGAEIDEDAPQEPLDVQGIHKAAAERHFRLAARLRNVAVVVLRLPACIGPHQPFEGDDVGLVGGFVRDVLAGRTILVFGRGRRRAIAFVDDVAEVVCRLVTRPADGFTAYNLRGEGLPIDELAARVVATAGRGNVEVTELPAEVAAIDSGAAMLREERLRAALGGEIPRTPLDQALRETVRYLQGVLA